MWPMKQKEPVSLAQQMQLEADAVREAQHQAAVDHLHHVDATHATEAPRLAATLAAAVKRLNEIRGAIIEQERIVTLASNRADTEKYDWRVRHDRAEEAARAKADPRLSAAVDHVERVANWGITPLHTRLLAAQLDPTTDIDALLAEAEAEHGSAPVTRTVTREQFRWGPAVR